MYTKSGLRDAPQVNGRAVHLQPTAVKNVLSLMCKPPACPQPRHQKLLKNRARVSEHQHPTTVVTPLFSSCADHTVHNHAIRSCLRTERERVESTRTSPEMAPADAEVVRAGTSLGPTRTTRAMRWRGPRVRNTAGEVCCLSIRSPVGLHLLPCLSPPLTSSPSHNSTRTHTGTRTHIHTRAGAHAHTHTHTQRRTPN
jgi:hypothetical protein